MVESQRKYKVYWCGGAYVEKKRKHLKGKRNVSMERATITCMTHNVL
jgi:hypothetical protein